MSWCEWNKRFTFRWRLYFCSLTHPPPGVLLHCLESKYLQSFFLEFITVIVWLPRTLKLDNAVSRHCSINCLRSGFSLFLQEDARLVTRHAHVFFCCGCALTPNKFWASKRVRVKLCINMMLLEIAQDPTSPFRVKCHTHTHYCEHGCWLIVTKKGKFG